MATPRTVGRIFSHLLRPAFPSCRNFQCELLATPMPLMGQAGQPGYLVVALARQQMIVPTLQTLLPSQREALARDWQAGHALLRSIRQFLRQELRVVRLDLGRVVARVAAALLEVDRGGDLRELDHVDIEAPGRTLGEQLAVERPVLSAQVPIAPRNYIHTQALVVTPAALNQMGVTNA